MTAYESLQQQLRAAPRTWLITGVAGFIGSHLLETLLTLGQRVLGVDNLTTGSPRNLKDVRARVTADAWKRFDFREGGILDIGICREAAKDVDFVLHHAGFVSVPLSIEDPIACHDTNVTGTLNVLVAARDRKVRRVVLASSSAVYGDHTRMPQIEAEVGRPLSPYAASKAVNETQARLFTSLYGLETVALRYFNVFGPRQNPRGGYAAVIPHWIASLLRGEECVINGDGAITRDFCPVADIVQANLLAATSGADGVVGEAFNVGRGGQTTLDELYALLAGHLARRTAAHVPPVKYGLPRAGDIQQSGADIAKIRAALGFVPTADLDGALDETTNWFAAAHLG